MQILTVLRHLSKSSHKRESESERKHKQINNISKIASILRAGGGAAIHAINILFILVRQMSEAARNGPRKQ
jgi:hypothetical protein